MTIQCPSCEKPYTVDDSLAGRQVKCRDCGQTFTASAAPAAAAPIPPRHSSRAAQAAPAGEGGLAVAVASAAVGFILGAIVGGAGYAFLIGPGAPQQPPAAAERPSIPDETPPTEPSTPSETPALAGLPSAPRKAQPDTAAPDRPPNRLLKRDEIVTWSDKVDRELKILEVSQPGALRVLESNPDAVHVVRISHGCMANKFNSEESQLLKDWVAGGGILWATNNVFSLFDVGFDQKWVDVDCTPSVTPDLCPILAGIERVSAPAALFVSCDLAHQRVVPLLAASKGSAVNTCYWSLIPYGKGWLSDVKSVNEEQYDSARFWLNFRMFCLGWDIPGAKITTNDFRSQYAEASIGSAG